MLPRRWLTSSRQADPVSRAGHCREFDLVPPEAPAGSVTGGRAWAGAQVLPVRSDTEAAPRRRFRRHTHEPRGERVYKVSRTREHVGRRVGRSESCCVHCAGMAGGLGAEASEQDVLGRPRSMGVAGVKQEIPGSEVPEWKDGALGTWGQV